MMVGGSSSPFTCLVFACSLSLCSIKGDGCEALAKALTENPSHLKHLDLRFNHPGESGDKMFKSLVNDSKCALVELRLVVVTRV